MDSDLIQSLRAWAKQYNNPDFIEKDPVRFPRRFTQKQDIEISGFLTAWISYGRRSLILSKAEELHRLMGEHPFDFIRRGDFRALTNNSCLSPSKRDTFYRFYTYTDLRQLCERLQTIYNRYDSLEAALSEGDICPDPIARLQELFAGIRGIPAPDSRSACKRLAMFLRWMVRQDGIVDLGIWRTAVHPRQLLIPLDTHVYQISRELGLTDRKIADLRTAEEVTAAMAAIFPDDPCLGDFALFGYDINNKR